MVSCNVLYFKELVVAFGQNHRILTPGGREGVGVGKGATGALRGMWHGPYMLHRPRETITYQSGL